MKSTLSVLILAMGAFSLSAQATDMGMITFDGAVSDTTCKITTNNGIDANNVTISMPVVTRDDVEGTTAATGGVGRKEFELMLTGCATALKSAEITFSSQQFAELSSGTLKPDAAVAGSAENVNIALYNNGNGNTAQVKIGDPTDASQSVTLANGSGVFAYAAAYVPSNDFDATSNPVVSGKVNTNVTFTMSYQ